MVKENIKEEKKEITIFKPQKGFQEDFLVSDADIVIGGGAAGSGKSFAILMDALYDIENPKFGYTYFRRNLTQIKKQGGLWDASMSLYSGITPKPTPKVSELAWEFPSGAKVSFNHLEYEKDIHSWQGTELPAIGFDELTHFSYTMFKYMLSRNRSTSGIKPRIRATTNPDPDSWVAKFIDWWIDDDGFPIPERSGKLRYFIQDGSTVDDIIWGDSKKEVFNKAGHIIARLLKKKKEIERNHNAPINPFDFIKSLTFIPGSIYDNEHLLSIDPGYLGNLASLDDINRAHLLEGNWKVKQTGEELVPPEKMYEIVGRSPQINGRFAITTDIALRGSDKMVIFVWNGFHLIDFNVLGSTNGKDVVNAIKTMMNKWHIQPRNVVYDANNLGGYIEGFIQGAKPFFNNGAPINGEFYNNLKSQCADRWAQRLNGNLYDNSESGKYKYSIDRKIAERKVEGETLIDHLLHERKAIRLADSSVDGKTAIIKKSEMKHIIGHSPDYIETMLMLEYLYLEGDLYHGHIIW